MESGLEHLHQISLCLSGFGMDCRVEYRANIEMLCNWMVWDGMRCKHMKMEVPNDFGVILLSACVCEMRIVVVQTEWGDDAAGLSCEMPRYLEADATRMHLNLLRRSEVGSRCSERPGSPSILRSQPFKPTTLDPRQL